MLSRTKRGESRHSFIYGQRGRVRGRNSVIGQMTLGARLLKRRSLMREGIDDGAVARDVKGFFCRRCFVVRVKIIATSVVDDSDWLLRSSHRGSRRWSPAIVSVLSLSGVRPRKKG